jgi:hypothetical protein
MSPRSGARDNLGLVTAPYLTGVIELVHDQRLQTCGNLERAGRKHKHFAHQKIEFLRWALTS